MLSESTPDSSSGGGTSSSRLSSLGSSSYDIGSSRLDAGSSRYERPSSRFDSLSTRLDKSPSRWDKDLDTSSAIRTSRYDTSGTSRLDRASKYSLEDSGTSRLERSSRFSITDDSGGSSRLERTSRFSVTESSDLDAAPSRWERSSSRYVTESTEPDISSYKSRISSKYVTESSDLDTGTSRYDRSSLLTRGTSELSDTGSTIRDRTTSRYAIETLDSGAPSSERYEERLLAELELEPSRWERTSSRYAVDSSDFDADYSRADKKTSRLTSVTSEADEPSRYDRSSRYVSEYTELDTGSPKWESEYSSQFNKWDTTGSKRLDRQSSRLSTDSIELDAGLSRMDSRTSRTDRQSSRSSELDVESSYKKSSNLETIQSYGLISEPIEGDSDSSGLVRTSSGIIRATVRRESEPDSEVDSTPAKPKVKKTIKSISQTGSESLLFVSFV